MTDIDEIARRLSALEGSTRAALQRIDTALARHDGDVAELRASRGAGIVTGPTERDADDIEFYRDLADKMREERDKAKGIADGWEADRALACAMLRESLGAPAGSSWSTLAERSKALRAERDDLERRLEIWQRTAADLERERDEARAELRALVTKIDAALGARR